MAIANNPPIPFFFSITILLLALHRHTHAATHWQDLHVLQQLKAAIIPSSITPASCLDSWDFSLDPAIPSSPPNSPAASTATTSFLPIPPPASPS